MVNFLLSNWYLVIIVIAVIAVAIAAIVRFIALPTSEQMVKIKEWLLYAVTAAEAELGSSTGEIKLVYVYDLFVTKFPVISKLVSFDTFSAWVDEVLVKFNDILDTSDRLQTYVYGWEM